jgi:hypothetical protein
LAASFDHLVGGDDERRRHIKAERFRCFQIDLQGDGDLFSLSPLFAGRGALSESSTRGEFPSPGLWSLSSGGALRRPVGNPTSLRIRLRQKAGFGGQERDEVTVLERRPIQPKAIVL